MSEEIGPTRRMVKEAKTEATEEEETREQRRYCQYREMLWEHIQGAHERYKGDMEAENGNGAFGETQALLALGRAYFGAEAAGG